MSKSEVVKRLKEHLKARKNGYSKTVSKDEKCYCLNYIMDFCFATKKRQRLF